MNNYQTIIEFSVFERLLKFVDSTDLFCLSLVSRSFFDNFYKYWRRLIRWERYDSMFGYSNIIENKSKSDGDHLLEIARDNVSDFNFDFMVYVKFPNQIVLKIQSLKYSRSFSYTLKDDFLCMSFLVVPSVGLRKKSNFYICLMEFMKSTIIVEYSNLFNIRYVLIKSTKIEHCLSKFFLKFYQTEHIFVDKNHYDPLSFKICKPRTNFDRFLPFNNSNKFRYLASYVTPYFMLKQYDGLTLKNTFHLLDFRKIINDGQFGVLQDKYLIRVTSIEISIYELTKNQIVPLFEYQTTLIQTSTTQLLSCALLVFVESSFNNDNFLVVLDILNKRLSKNNVKQYNIYDYVYVSWTTNKNNSTLYCLANNQQIESFKLKYSLLE